MKFVHSLSTRPMLQPCYGIDGLKRLLAQVWYFSLSVAYIKRLGAEISLHTDSLGAAMLSHLPYSDIHLTLDPPSGIHPRFWAAGKFLSLQKEEAPVVHIDGDVFIKSPLCLNTIEELLRSHPIVVQSSDPARMYVREVPLFEKEPEFCAAHYCTPDGQDALNTGILGFRDEVTRENVVKNYLEIARYFSEKHAVELEEDDFLTPDLIAEQKMITGWSEAHGQTPGILLSDISRAQNIGYQHVYTVAKFRSLKMCADTLRIINPAIYRATELICMGFDGSCTHPQDK